MHRRLKIRGGMRNNTRLARTLNLALWALSTITRRGWLRWWQRRRPLRRRQ